MNALTSDFNALQDTQEEIQRIEHDLSFTSVTDENQYQELTRALQDNKSKLNSDTSTFISDLYTSSHLSETDTLDFIKQVDENGFSNFADQFRYATALTYYNTNGASNTLHDAHAYLRECRVDRASNYHGNKNRYLNQVYTCMQDKDYDQLDMVDKPLATIGMVVSYPIMLLLAILLSGATHNTVSKSRKLKEWENKEGKSMTFKTSKPRH